MALTPYYSLTFKLFHIVRSASSSSPITSLIPSSSRSSSNWSSHSTKNDFCVASCNVTLVLPFSETKLKNIFQGCTWSNLFVFLVYISKNISGIYTNTYKSTAFHMIFRFWQWQYNYYISIWRAFSSIRQIWTYLWVWQVLYLSNETTINVVICMVYQKTCTSKPIFISCFSRSIFYQYSLLVLFAFRPLKWTLHDVHSRC